MLFDNEEMEKILYDVMNLKKGSYDYNDNNFYSSKEGFLRGNMFKNEYLPFKGMTYLDLVPKTEKEAMLFNVMQYSFAINDLNLYLDLHPDDSYAYSLFKKYVEEEKRAKNEYVKNYGPIDLDETTGAHYDWLNDWPWEKGGSKYV